MMDIIPLDNISRMLEEPFVGWLRDQKLITESPIDVLAKIWSGAYKVYIGMDNFKPIGMIVCQVENGRCLTVLVYAKNHLLALRNQFYALLKQEGCQYVCTYSKNRSKGYERLTGMEYVYSYYERRL